MTVDDFRSDAGAQRKAKIAGGAIVVALLWLMWPSGPARPKAVLPPPPPVRPTQPPITPAPPTVPVVAAVPVPKAVSLETLLPGVWQGRAAETSEMCDMRLEVRPKADGFSGYPTVTCRPLNAIARRRVAALIAVQPSSAILTGAIADGAIDFHTDSTLGHCGIQSMTARPFGSGELAVDWQDACRQGAMVLAKLAK